MKKQLLGQPYKTIICNFVLLWSGAVWPNISHINKAGIELQNNNGK